MPSRDALPPPPPPVHLRTWPHREALLADRARALVELSRSVIGGRRLAYWLLTLAGLVVGVRMVTGSVGWFQQPQDPLTVVAAALLVCLGLAVLAPLVVAVVLGVRHDRTARDRARAWAALDPAPVRDPGLRAPGLSLAWLLLAFAQCAGGLWLSFAVPASARPGETTYAEVALAMGDGLVLWISGLIGAFTAVGHRRLVLALAPPVTPRRG
ncbi:hypothetical protein [Streptomyces sp. NPDC015131]|uniref:hypothetical protein n=1 Tax=Streptomyces sp. NPDC015131 TaxID=3364941 RepID=UPI0036FF6D9E